MKTERRQLGAAPVHPVTGSAAPAPQGMPSREEGMNGSMSVPQTAIPIIVDALNESIIALKVEIHRTQDREQRRKLEQMAENLRQQILGIGGDPIWADESIEDGLQKLRGVGYVGYEAEGALLAGLPPAPYAHSVYADMYRGATSPMAAPRPARQPKPAPTTIPTAPTTKAPATAPKAPPLPTSQPRLYGAQIQPPDTLSQILQSIGESPAPSAMPQMRTSVEAFNQLIQQYGLAPRTQEEIEQHASNIIDRATLERTQIIQREIDRFESDFPHEFEKAKTRIQKEAAAISAERQEEMASRGLYYSSIMAGALTTIDERTLEMINDISMEAARYVNSLNRQITDIEEMAILEKVVLAQQMWAEERQFGAQLAQMQMQVSMFVDQLALDAWYKENSLALQHRQTQLQELQLRIQEAERMGQHLATAFMADHPLVQRVLQGMGISPQAFGKMSLEQQSHMVNNIVGYEQISQQMRLQEVQMQSILADMALSQQRLALDRQKLALMAQENQKPMSQYHPEQYALGRAAIDGGNFDYARQIIGALREDGYSATANALESYLRQVESSETKTNKSTAKFFTGSRFQQDWEIIKDFFSTAVGPVGKDSLLGGYFFGP